MTTSIPVKDLPKFLQACEMMDDVKEHTDMGVEVSGIFMNEYHTLVSEFEKMSGVEFAPAYTEYRIANREV